MAFVGKLHEIFFYAFITSICRILLGKGDISLVLVILIPFLIIAIVGAILTKHFDNGEGLTFNSDKVLVIMFAHIAEEILGLFLTPIWFIKDVIAKKKWDKWKTFDYISYFIEVAVGILFVLF